MICKIKDTIRKNNMFSSSRRVIIGVSGGADSCALLYALYLLREELSLEITVAHVNHGIRGEEARRDENFVKALCEKLQVEFKVAHFDVPSIAKERGKGIEECARELRYEFFQSIDSDATIATAHNSDDCCETLIFNIARGTSPKGIASIPAVRGRIVRPLINCTRAEIEAFCKENGLDFVTDSTNNDDTYTRNKIRHHIIPAMKEINPSLNLAVSRLTEDARLDNEYFDFVVSEAVCRSKCEKGYDCLLIKENHKAIIKRMIAHIIKEEIGCAPENKHIAAVYDILDGGKTRISGATDVTVKNGILSFGNKALTEPWETEISPGKATCPIGEVTVEIINNSDLKPIQFVHKNVLDYGAVSGNLTLRSRREGDEIRIAGRNCTKKLKKLFIEAKIEDKNSVCVLADDKGIVWVEGFGCAERCKITTDTKSVLKIEIFRGV